MYSNALLVKAAELYYARHSSQKEIAQHLGKTEEACRQILRRGLIRLELALEERGAGS